MKLTIEIEAFTSLSEGNFVALSSDRVLEIFVAVTASVWDGPHIGAVGFHRSGDEATLWNCVVSGSAKSPFSKSQCPMHS
jgi:hypothetical protein